jgi:competence protein ComK
MFIVNYYIINLQMVLMLGEYNRYGKLCTRVVELDKSFLVDKSPLEVLNDTTHYIGFDFKRNMRTTKMSWGKGNICPVIVNPIHGICMFPNKAHYHTDTIWFNPLHIVKTWAVGAHTVVDLSTGFSIEIHSRLSGFNRKLQHAKQLGKLILDRGKSPITFILEKKKQPLLTKNKLGYYNFDILETK